MLLAAFLDLQAGRMAAAWLSRTLGAEELRLETEDKARGLLEAFAAGAVPGRLELEEAQRAFEGFWPGQEKALEALYES